MAHYVNKTASKALRKLYFRVPQPVAVERERGDSNGYAK
jgi:hypothetical protein